MTRTTRHELEDAHFLLEPGDRIYPGDPERGVPTSVRFAHLTIDVEHEDGSLPQITGPITFIHNESESEAAHHRNQLRELYLSTHAALVRARQTLSLMRAERDNALDLADELGESLTEWINRATGLADENQHLHDTLDAAGEEQPEPEPYVQPSLWDQSVAWTDTTEEQARSVARALEAMTLTLDLKGVHPDTVRAIYGLPVESKELVRKSDWERDTEPIRLLELALFPVRWINLDITFPEPADLKPYIAEIRHGVIYIGGLPEAGWW